MKRVIFLKLGGSLITEKDKPAKPRVDVILRVAGEIAEARAADPEVRLLLGHGSGSFGHTSAAKYATRQGVRTPQEWVDFGQVWRDAAALNHIVMDALIAKRLPAITFPVSSSAVAYDGEIARWEFAPIEAALQGNLLPVIYGDVVIDEVRGGTVLSTEELFFYLARRLKPERIFLAGIESGIYSDFPRKGQMIQSITTTTYSELASRLQGSIDTDITGGMAAKVRVMLELVGELQDCEAFIFSGLERGNIFKALSGEQLGTQLTFS